MGTLYLGSQKVCPAIIAGQPEPREYDSVIRIQDNISDLELSVSSSYSNFSDDITNKILLDLNNVEKIDSTNLTNSGGFSYFIHETSENLSVSIKADKLKEINSKNTFSYFVQTQPEYDRENNAFYDSVIRFPLLEKIADRNFVFFVNKGLTDIYFPKLKTANADALYYIAYKAKAPLTLHFAANQELLVTSLTTYPTFGSSYSVTILYDQPATE